jgi:hypothetical protein
MNSQGFNMRKWLNLSNYEWHYRWGRSNGARDEAARPDAVPVALMNGEQLVALLVENNIGVTRHSHDLIELGESEIIETT